IRVRLLLHVENCQCDSQVSENNAVDEVEEGSRLLSLHPFRAGISEAGLVPENDRQTDCKCVLVNLRILTRISTSPCLQTPSDIAQRYCVALQSTLLNISASLAELRPEEHRGGNSLPPFHDDTWVCCRVSEEYSAFLPIEHRS